MLNIFHIYHMCKYLVIISPVTYLSCVQTKTTPRLFTISNCCILFWDDCGYVSKVLTDALPVSESSIYLIQLIISASLLSRATPRKQLEFLANHSKIKGMCALFNVSVSIST